MAATATIAFRVKPEIKKRADALFARLGMTTSTGMNVLLMQTLDHRGFPFAIMVPDAAMTAKTAKDSTGERPNEETLRAIDDLDSGRNLSRYATFDDMVEDVL